MPKETGKTKNVCEESLRPDSVDCDRAYIIVGLAGGEVDVENVPGGDVSLLLLYLRRSVKTNNKV